MRSDVRDGCRWIEREADIERPGSHYMWILPARWQTGFVRVYVCGRCSMSAPRRSLTRIRMGGISDLRYLRLFSRWQRNEEADRCSGIRCRSDGQLAHQKDYLHVDGVGRSRFVDD